MWNWTLSSSLFLAPASRSQAADSGPRRVPEQATEPEARTLPSDQPIFFPQTPIQITVLFKLFLLLGSLCASHSVNGKGELIKPRMMIKLYSIY